jgi:hypothetical protein
MNEADFGEQNVVVRISINDGKKRWAGIRRFSGHTEREHRDFFPEILRDGMDSLVEEVITGWAEEQSRDDD